VTVTAMDPILRWIKANPFDRMAATTKFYWVVKPDSGNAERWPNEFAQFALEKWHESREVWVEKSALATAPEEQSLWVEGDHPAIHWRDVPAFFRGFEYDGDTGARGFLRLARTARNEAELRRLE